MADSLPYAQIIALTCYRIGEGSVWSVIVPYVNEQITRAGVSTELVGVTGAAAECSFMLAECFTAPCAALLANKWGRKPVFLGGMMLFSTAGVVYSFSSTVFWIITLRLIQGACCGAGGTLSRTILMETVDKTQLVRSFAIFTPGLILGMSLGGWIGGHLSWPAKKFAVFKGSQLFTDYPYLLPNLTVGIMAWIFVAYSSVVLKETGRRRSVQDASASHSHRTFTFWELVAEPSVRSILVYITLLSLTSFSYEVIVPLEAFSDVELGGWGLSVPTIGNITSLTSLLGMFMSIFGFPYFSKRLGNKLLFRTTAWCHVFVAFTFPMLGYLAKAKHAGGVWANLAFWLVMAIQVVIKRFGDLEYTSIDVVIPGAVPHPDAMAMTNGLLITFGGFGRAFGPLALGGMWGISEGGSEGSLRRQMSWITMLVFALIPAAMSLASLAWMDGRPEYEKGGAEAYELLQGDEIDEEDDGHNELKV